MSISRYKEFRESRPTDAEEDLTTTHVYKVVDEDGCTLYRREWEELLCKIVRLNDVPMLEKYL